LALLKRFLGEIMAELKIPERHKKGILKLFELSNDSFDEIVSAFEGIGPKFSPEQLSAEVGSKIKGISSTNLVEMIAALLSLISHRVRDETPPEELAEQVVQAMTEVTKDLKDKQELLKQRLVRFFKIETLLVAAKAAGVLQSHENTFCNARILTDMRPVFGSDATVTPNAAVIVHMLNLSYHHEGELKEIYLAMDTIDIEILREVLDRADLKCQSLKSLIQRAGVTYLDPYR
jgi:hypothetical protein